MKELSREAEDLFRSGKFYCSEAVFYVINKYLGYPVPEEAVRIASGFPIGIGKTGCLCGALSGGVMALGLKYGRSSPGDQAPKILELSRKLTEQFKARFAHTCCREITKAVQFASQDRREKCIAITGAVVADVLRLFEEV
jgi:C_GCAxxG_C_C family probable redox protein